MKTYEVALIRTYIISIQAENEEQAKRYSEYFIGDCSNLSSEEDRKLRKFFIKNIELVYNEANEIVAITE